MKITFSIETEDEKALLFLNTLTKAIETAINTLLRTAQATQKAVMTPPSAEVSPGDLPETDPLDDQQ